MTRPPEREPATTAVPNALLGAAAHERSAADVWESMRSPQAAPMSLAGAAASATPGMQRPAREEGSDVAVRSEDRSTRKGGETHTQARTDRSA